MANRNDRFFDMRTLERNLEKGLITHEEYEQYLQSVPDSAGYAEKVKAEFVEGVLDDDDDEEGDET